MKEIIFSLVLFFTFTWSFTQGKIAQQYKEKGTEYAKQGNFEEAIENLNKAIQIHPNYAAAYNNRGIVKMQLNKYQEAIADFNQAIKINNQDPAYYINRAMTYEKSLLIDKAINDYGSAIDLDPYKADYYIKRGILFNRQKKYKSAVDDFNMAIQLVQDESDYYYYRGLSKLSSEQFYDGHKDFFKAAQMGNFKAKNMIVDIFFNTIPDDEELALSIRSSMKFHLNDYEGAITDLNELIKASPKNGTAYLKRGISEIQIKDRKKACKDFKKALDLGEFSAKEFMEKYCGK